MLINETLLRAIRTESAEALKHWFGVGAKAVMLWRRAFGVGRRGTPGSRRLYDRVEERLREQLRGIPLRPKVKMKMRRAAIARDAAKSLREYAAQHRREWSAADAALIGTMKDTRLAKRLGLTRDDVHSERVRRGIAAYRKPPSPESLLSPEERERLRRERIAAAKRGKRRPKHVIEAMRKGRTAAKGFRSSKMQ